MRLINADALIAEYDREHIGEPGKARKLIEDAPTIEPERTGKWVETLITEEYSYYTCSACKQATKIPKYIGWLLYDYCPNCGARMEQ